MGAWFESPHLSKDAWDQLVQQVLVGIALTVILLAAGSLGGDFKAPPGANSRGQRLKEHVKMRVERKNKRN